MQVVTILGARPQFIKASVISLAFQKTGIEEILIHTGQHFDPAMSDVFFQDLDLPEPHLHLNVHGLPHGAMTGRMMEGLEKYLLDRRPNWVCVYGDTNSTLAGALVAAKLNIPLAHIEAGLRSYNRQMPEEVNRVVTDHLSQLLFAPTPLAVQCLQSEGITQGVHQVGDVMMDAVLTYQEKAKQSSMILAQHQLGFESFYLATIHRPSNTDDPGRLKAILENLSRLDHPVIFPVHPRTVSRLQEMRLNRYLAEDSTIKAIPPVSYLDMLMLESNAKAVITDSGGMQKEAYIFERPCFTIRNETEWRETVDIGWNHLTQPEQLTSAIAQFQRPPSYPPLYGFGDAANQISDIFLNSNNKLCP